MMLLYIQLQRFESIRTLQLKFVVSPSRISYFLVGFLVGEGVGFLVGDDDGFLVGDPAQPQSLGVVELAI
jgi:hypothetical protein